MSISSLEVPGDKIATDKTSRMDESMLKDESIKDSPNPIEGKTPAHAFEIDEATEISNQERRREVTTGSLSKNDVTCDSYPINTKDMKARVKRRKLAKSLLNGEVHKVTQSGIIHTEDEQLNSEIAIIIPPGKLGTDDQVVRNRRARIVQSILSGDTVQFHSSVTIHDEEKSKPEKTLIVPAGKLASVMKDIMNLAESLLDYELSFNFDLKKYNTANLKNKSLDTDKRDTSTEIKTTVRKYADMEAILRGINDEDEIIERYKAMKKAVENYDDLQAAKEAYDSMKVALQEYENMEAERLEYADIKARKRRDKLRDALLNGVPIREDSDCRNNRYPMKTSFKAFKVDEATEISNKKKRQEVARKLPIKKGMKPISPPINSVYYYIRGMDSLGEEANCRQLATSLLPRGLCYYKVTKNGTICVDKGAKVPLIIPRAKRAGLITPSNIV